LSVITVWGANPSLTEQNGERGDAIMHDTKVRHPESDELSHEDVSVMVATGYFEEIAAGEDRGR
jgi:hypothetical protein